MCLGSVRGLGGQAACLGPGPVALAEWLWAGGLSSATQPLTVASWVTVGISEQVHTRRHRQWTWGFAACLDHLAVAVTKCHRLEHCRSVTVQSLSHTPRVRFSGQWSRCGEGHVPPAGSRDRPRLPFPASLTCAPAPTAPLRFSGPVPCSSPAPPPCERAPWSSRTSSPCQTLHFVPSAQSLLSCARRPQD